jgi:sensory rhodopsin
MANMTESLSLLSGITAYMFILGFAGMAAGTLYFLQVRSELSAKVRSVAIYASVITFVATIMYYIMATNIWNGGSIEGTVVIRYVDWIITTPLLLLEFAIIAALAGKIKKGLVARLVIADIIMIVAGFLGETMGAAGDAATYVWFIISVLAWIWIIIEIFGVKATGKGFAASSVNTMKWFVIIGWSIYPLGTAIQQFMSLGSEPGSLDLATAAAIAAIVYIVADLVNKVVFGIVAVRAAKNA